MVLKLSKLSSLLWNSKHIGLPQILKILADAYIDNEGNLDENLINYFNLHWIYQQSILSFIGRHRTKVLGGMEKDIQDVKLLNIVAKHQQLAMKHFFPDVKNFITINLGT